MIFDKPLADYGDLMTIAEFLEHVESGLFTDDDGMGSAVKDGLRGEEYIYPSSLDSIPPDVTHIQWFNK